jgi:HK97 family phage major capsid protein
MDELKKAIEDLQKSWADYRKTNDDRIAALAKGGGTSEIDARLAKIDADLVKNQKTVDDLNALQAQVNRMNLGTSAGGGKPQKNEEFAKWMKAGDSREFKAAATSDVDPAGGFFVMPEVESEITRVAMKTVAMRQLARVRTISSGSLKKTVSKGGASAGWVAERDARAATANPELDVIEIFAREMYAEPSASQILLDDSFTDVASWLGDEAGVAFSDLESAAFINGEGMNMPRGILSYDKVANASYAWGKLGYLITGVSGGWTAADPADKLIDLVHALKPKYRGNGSFLMNDLTMASARKLKSTTGAGANNSYLWEPSIVAGQPARLLGYPVHSDDNMPDIAADKFSIAFGDYSAGYQIVDRAGISVLRDPYTQKGFVKFYTTRRVGGGIVNYEAIKLLKFGTA